MWNAELFIASKGVDPEAQTAKSALKDSLRLEHLDRLLRHDVWTIKTNLAQREKAKKLAAFLAEKTSVFVNPNKHVYDILLVNKPVLQTHFPRLSGFCGHIYVHNLEDAKPELAFEHLKNIYKISLKGLDKGVLWSVQLREDKRSPAQLRKILNQVAMTFFVNKHFQVYKIIISP